VKEWLKSVLNYQSYPKNKTEYPFFWNTLYLNSDFRPSRDRDNLHNYEI